MSSSYQHQEQSPLPNGQKHQEQQQQQSKTPLTPKEVVEKMSFFPVAGGADAAAGKATANDQLRDETWQPLAPPPSAPPPPPPPIVDSPVVGYNNNNNNEDRFTDLPTTYGSYGYQQTSHMPTTHTSDGDSSSLGGRSRSAPFPTITNFGFQEDDGTSDAPGRTQSLPIMRGDASLRPNTGQTNDAYGGIGSLTEIATQLRWTTVGICVTAVIWEGFAFPTRLLIQAWVHPAKVVLGGYLGVFCILFLGVDFGWKLQDTIGILYHPLGRGFLLLFMASMCFGILVSWWECLLGIAFLYCGGMYMYAYWNYPEYRRWQSYEENTMWQDVKDAVKRRSHGWANPDAVEYAANMAWNTAANSSGGGATASEQQSLLNPV